MLVMILSILKKVKLRIMGEIIMFIRERQIVLCMLLTAQIMFSVIHRWGEDSIEVLFVCSTM